MEGLLSRGPIPSSFYTLTNISDTSEISTLCLIPYRTFNIVLECGVLYIGSVLYAVYLNNTVHTFSALNAVSLQYTVYTCSACILYALYLLHHLPSTP